MTENERLRALLAEAQHALLTKDDDLAASLDARIDAAIARTRAFYESIGIKTRLSDYGVSVETAAEVARRLAARGMVRLGERGDITPAKVEQILRLAA